MRKQLFPLLLIAFLCTALCGVATAQVRQTVKVMDYGTGQPMAGVQVTCGGQTQTTNAKGLAIFTYAGKAYGDYLDMDIQLRKTGFISVGRDWNSRKLATDVLTKEPIVLHMVKAERYSAELERLFDSLFLFRYREIYLPLLEQAAAEAADDPGEAIEWAKSFVSWNLYDNAWKTLYEIADDINPLCMHYIDSNLRKTCEKALSDGDLKGCLALARAQIADNDSSEENLQRIYYYLTIHDAAEDTTPASKYYKILFDHGFNMNSGFIIMYMNCLSGEGKDKEVKALRTYAKDNCKDLYMKLLISRPHTNELYASSMGEAVTEALSKVRIIDEISPNSVLIRSHYRRLAAYYLLLSGDTIQANRQLDTVMQMLDRTDSNNFHSELDRLLNMNDELNGLVQFPDGIDSALAATIMARHIGTTGRIYSIQPTFSSRILHYYALKNSLEEYDSATMLRIREMDRILPELQKVIPEIMYPEQLRIKELLLQGNLYLRASNEEITRCFNDYKEAIQQCEARIPFMHSYGLAANYNIKVRCHQTENTFLLQPLEAHTHAILEQISRLLHEDSLLTKGSYFKMEAVKLSEGELYEPALSTCDKAIGYYQRYLPTNDSACLDILNTLLQKGSTYLQMERLPESFACYQQVLDYEKQIPSHLKVPYDIIKAKAMFSQGNLYALQKDYKKAMKCYGQSEKVFKQVEKSGDTTFYASWGLMHYSKAFAHYNAGQEKQCMEELQRAEQLYDTYPLTEVSQQYEQLKEILSDYYKESNNGLKYIACLYKYLVYCDTVKDNDYAYYEDECVKTAILIGDVFNKAGYPYLAVQHYKLAKEGKDSLIPYGGEKDLQYLLLLAALGKQYWLIDSLETAMDYLYQGIELNHRLFSQSDPGQCNINDLDLKSQIVKCINDIPDSIKSSLQRDEAIALQKEIVARLGTMDTTPALRRNLAYHHRQLGVIYADMEWYQMAISQLDSSIAIAQPMYDGGDHAENEEELIRSHYISAVVNYYMLEERDEKEAKKHLEQCLTLCEKAVSLEDIIDIYYRAVNMKLEMLADPFATKDEAAIKKYRKIKTALEKKLGYKNPPSER